MVETEIVPSFALATKASVPARLIEVPLGPRPVSSVATTAGGFAWRSITVSLLSGTIFFGSVGSSFMLDATSPIDSSGAIATFCGGPTTLEGALSSPTTLGGETPRSMRVTVSSAGFGGTVLTPLTSTALPSLEETAICAAAWNEKNGSMRSATGRVLICRTRGVMSLPPKQVFYGGPRSHRARDRRQRRIGGKITWNHAAVVASQRASI